MSYFRHLPEAVAEQPGPRASEEWWARHDAWATLVSDDFSLGGMFWLACISCRFFMKLHDVRLLFWDPWPKLETELFGEHIETHSIASVVISQGIRCQALSDLSEGLSGYKRGAETGEVE